MSKPIYVLGTHVSHDGSACLLRDGKICAAIEKERITKRKHDGQNDTDAILYCLEQENIHFCDLDLIVQNSQLGGFPEARLITDDCPVPVITISHHLAHAYSAIGACNFSESSVLVIDGSGNTLDLCTDLPGDSIPFINDIPRDRWSDYGEVDSSYYFDGRDCTLFCKRASSQRWDHSLYFDQDKNKKWKTYSKWGGFLDEVNEFDPLFFNISPREADILDPQERLFLQCAFECMEDAGYSRQALVKETQGKVGVYTGVMWTEYQLYGAQETVLGRPLALSSGASSVANRVSYFCNFNGPSLAVDTMCSSSLTAIHLACQSIAQGECMAAIAGGVNVTIHPNKYLVLGYGKLASTKGLCESFGAGGDGYVPGEGVGAVLLKPLAQAIADGDNIYGVIKGSAINHGGKVNGYSVPNPRAQGLVIREALGMAGFDARTVSYVEAHGTGTALGDPIEISGLTSGFDSQEKQFCAIGSVKSNIGHCESAAGIAGLTKVLLQMKYGKLAPSLHSAALNPNIDFSDSPFVVQQELAEWKRPVLGSGDKRREFTRRAGISSFGAGGANAHMVVEEYIPAPSAVSVPQDLPGEGSQESFAILLSAKNEPRLLEMTRNLLNLIERNNYGDKDLANIAYTLQVGREALDDRLGMEVYTMQELKEMLTHFFRGAKIKENMYLGSKWSDKGPLSIFMSDEDLESTMDSWLRKRKNSKLLPIWAWGFEVDWEKQYGDRHPQRISLPTYPFLRNRYWPIEREGKVEVNTSAAVSYKVHPLVHHNTSTFAVQKFSSTFSGEEFFIKDHVVGGKKMLPGAAYLEMVNEAMALAGGGKRSDSSRSVIQLENIIWAAPLVLNGHPETIEIGLVPGADGEVRFAISSEAEEGKAGAVTHSQGTARYMERGTDQVLDIDALKTEMNRETLDVDGCYALFTKMGISYGPAQRGIQKIYAGEGKVLARLVLPPEVSNTLDQYYVHPSLMDASLQAAVGLLDQHYNIEGALPMAVPFAIQSVKIIRPCATDMWAYVRRNPKMGKNAEDSGRQQSFDIDLCDLSGRVCVKVEGFVSRIVKGDGGVPEEEDVVLMEPYWKQQEVVKAGEPIAWSKHIVMTIENDALAKAISQQLPNTVSISSNLSYTAVEKGFEGYARQIFREVKKILGSGLMGKTLVQVVVPVDDEKQVFLAIAGMLMTAGMENPLFTGQVMGVGEGEDVQKVIGRLRQNMQASDATLRYRKDKREVLSIREYISGKVSEPMWQDGGVYLITGGCGGLGLIFAREIVRKAGNVVLVLTGRSELNEERAKQLEELRIMGATVHYRAADIGDSDATTGLVKEVMQLCGRIDGIIHSAGVIHDNFILRKKEEEIGEVFAPKVNGVMNLDMATKEIDLRFFILFSSGSGLTGNIGQADYAMANAYLDRYAAYRASLVSTGQRKGKTLSVNWPLWRDGGMHVSKAQEDSLRENIGMAPLETTAGVNALYEAMASGVTQMMVVQGQVDKVKNIFLGARAAVQEEQVKPVDRVASPGDPSKMTELLKQVMSDVIQLPADQINADRAMSDYGIDSVMVMQMTRQLEKEFGSLSKTLFFEYRNIRELTEYFLTNFPGKRRSGEEEAAPVSAPVPALASAPKIANRLALGASDVRTVPDAPLDIAIIGVAGRYPQARDLKAFWDVLKEGKDCITEIPGSRWDANLYFDAEKNKLGKSYSKWGGFLEGMDEFDPLFFGISAREAEMLDPQERLFLQCAYETLEDAGYQRRTIRYDKKGGESGNVGVYVGVMWQEYMLYGAQETALGRPLTVSGVAASIANRVSYFCDFNGLSITLNTMCSSSLVAIHLACQSIREGECSAAIAGGVNLSLHPNKYMALGYANFLSGKGLCESFGAGAEGYVPGEGVGAVLLKPLARAIEDKDHIYAVIKGSAANHGGRTNNFTVPNPVAQAEVIGKAMKIAGFDPRTITCLEAQGTGTILGDSIEIAGLKRAFDTNERHFCSLGSVKSNIGHCESASGIASLTKVILQMKHRQLVPSLHSGKLNPSIDFENSPFVVQQHADEWKRPSITKNGITTEYPRRAGVSAFGAGGANAHLVLEEWVPTALEEEGTEAIEDGTALIVLSARTADQLNEIAAGLMEQIGESGEISLRKLKNIAYTLQVGREPMKQRLAFAVTSLRELKDSLGQFLKGEITKHMYIGQVYAVTDTDPTLIDGWIAGRAYESLLDAWVKGAAIEWRKLYEGERIPLPSYPFAREKYWIPDTGGGGTSQPATAAAPKAVEEQPDHKRILPLVENKLRELFARLVKFRTDQIDLKESLFSYGVDSIMIQLFNGWLADIFGELPSGVAYDHPTLESLAGYLAMNQYHRSEKWVSSNEK